MDDLIKYYTDLIIDRNLDIELYLQLFREEKWDEMFELALSNDFLEIIEFLYREMGCKFYLNRYTSQMDQDLLHLLNDDQGGKKEGFKLVCNNKDTDSFQYLLSMRRYSKLLKDEKGFYYVFSKK